MPDFETLSRVVLAFCIFGQAGYLFLRAVKASHLEFSFLEMAGLSLGLGVGLVTTEMLIFSMAGLSFSLATLSAPWIAGWTVYLARKVTHTHSWPKQSAVDRIGQVLTALRSFGLLDAAMLLALGTVLAALLFRAAFHPIFEWDGWAIWDLKARAFYYHRSIFPFIQDRYYALSHLDYPVLVPLAGTLLYLTLGKAADLVLLIPAIFYASLLAVFYSNLRRFHANRNLSILLTLGLAFMPSILFWSQHYYAETPLLYFVFSSMAYLFFFFVRPCWSFLLISAAAAGFATQTKVEGLLLIVPALAALLVKTLRAQPGKDRRRSFTAASIYALLVMALYVPWFVVRTRMALGDSTLSSVAMIEVLQHLSLLPKVSASVLKWMAQPTYQGLFFLIPPVTLVLALSHWRKYGFIWPYNYLLGHILLLLVPYLAFFLVEPHWLELIRLGRYLIVFTGLCYYLFALQTVALFQSDPLDSRLASAGVNASPKSGRSSSLELFQKALVVLTLFAVLLIDPARDVWPAGTGPAAYSSRPVSFVRQVSAAFRNFSGLTMPERKQFLESQSSRPEFGRLVQLVLDTTPAGENVALIVRSENPENRPQSYLRQRSYSMLYPRKVFLFNDPSEMSVTEIQEAHIGAVIAYDIGLSPGTLPGQLVYESENRFFLSRTNLTEAWAQTSPYFVSAPVHFEENILLLGFLPEKFLDEDALWLILNWKSTRKIPGSYTVFLHLFDGAGNLIAQHDSPPGLGQMPTELWEPGMVVADSHPLRVRAEKLAGSSFCLGMYDSITLARLTIHSAEGYDVHDNVACRLWPNS